MVLKVKSKKLDNPKKNSISPKKEANTIKAIKPVLNKKPNNTKENENEKAPVKLKSLTNPYKDKLFLKTLNKVKNESSTIQKHPLSENKKIEIKEASFLDLTEQSKNNNLQEHYSSIEKSTKVNEEKKFSAKKFKNLLKIELDNIEDKLPKSSSSAKTFKKAKHINKLKKSVNSKILISKKDTLGKLESNIDSQVENNTRETTDAKELIKEDDLNKSKNIVNTKYASPKKRYDNEISLEDENKKVDSLMEQDNISEEQLSSSNEEKFITALDSKKEAKKKADLAPLEYREKEKNILSTSRKKVNDFSTFNFNNMTKTRNNSFTSVYEKQTSTKDKNLEKKRNINKKFEDIYTSTKIKVSTKLDGISAYIDEYFKENGSVNNAKKRFEKNVERKLDKIYGWTTLDDKIFGEDKNAINKVFKDEKKKFMNTLNIIFDSISAHIAKALNESIKVIEDGKKKNTEIYSNLSTEEKKLIQESYDNFNDKYKDLENKVNEKEKELVKSLASKYKKSVSSLDESFKAIKKKVSSSWIEKAIDSIKSVISTIKKLAKMLYSLASEISSFIPKILENPVSFLKLLFKGVKKGVALFTNNIKEHLIGGFIKWLTGSMTSVGIVLPKNVFSLSGIFSLVMQILDLGWDFIRKKAVKLFGEPAVKVLEKTYEMLKIIKKDGIKGIWKYLKDKFNDLKQMIIEEIQSMLITQVFLAGAKWLASLFIPGAAFIKAIIAIKDFIVTLVQSAFALIPIIIKAIKALASGDIKGLSKLVEKGLASLVPILISLFAKILGLGGIAKKVIKIVERIRARINRAIDKLIDKVKKFFNKSNKNQMKTTKNDVSTKKLDKTLGEELKFKVGSENHKLWIKSSGRKIELIVESKPLTTMERLELWEKKINTLDIKNQKDAKDYISKAKNLSKSILGEAKKEDVLKKTILKDKITTKDEYKKLSKSDKEVVLKEMKLKNYLILLFDIFAYDKIDLNDKNFELKIRKDSIAILKTLLKEKNHLDSYNVIIEKYENREKNESGFISSRIGFIKKELNSKYDELIVDKKFSNINLQEILKNYLINTLTKTSVPEHKKYEPNSTIDKIIIKYKKFIIKYKYKDEIHKDRSFTVSYDFNKLNKNDKEVTQESLGENLLLKESAGIDGRGKTDATKNFLNDKYKKELQEEIKNAKSNLIIIRKKIVQIQKELDYAINKSDKRKEIEAKKKFENLKLKKQRLDNIIDNKRAINYKDFTNTKKDAKDLQKSVEGYKKHEHLFESAHMIADEFLGSGYKEALNLLVTSEEYNRVTMRSAERSIKSEVQKNENGLFDLKVKATWDYLKDAEIKAKVNPTSLLKKDEYKSLFQEIKDKSEKDENQKILSKSLFATLNEYIASKDDPKRVLGVEYTGFLNVPRSQLEKRKIGCDIWMSSYFDFDKEKCRYKV